MEKLKELSSTCNSFFRNHLLLLVIIALGGWWFFGGNGSPIVFEQSLRSNHNYTMEESMDSVMPMMTKNVSFGRGGGIVPPAYADFDPTATERKIVKNANLEIEVEDTEKAKTETEAQIKDLGGAITQMNSWEVRPGMLAYNLTTRIPADKLEKAMEALEFLGIKKSENYSTSDITAQYADSENRLKNLEVRRDRLREMMERKTDNLGDVLQIDRELSSVQMQIENLERTLRRHDTNVAYSTLRLTLKPEPQIGDVANPHWSMSKSWKMSFNELIQDSQGLADKLIMIVVYIPIWVPILLILWWARRKFWNKKKK